MKKKLKKVLNFIQSIDKGILLIGLAIIVALVILIVLFANATKLSESDKKVINDASDKYMNYMNLVEESTHDDNGKYINYAIVYINNEEEKTNITVTEVINVLDKIFDIQLTEEEISKIGITEDMFNSGVVYEPTVKEFSINNTKTNQDIQATELKKYIISKISKKGKNKFVVTYDKYKINDPYRILNYYHDFDVTFDTEPIKKYLQGKANVKTILNYVNDTNISKVGEKVSKLKVTYIFKDGNLKIDSFKTTK